MVEHSDNPQDLQALRKKVIGLGNESIQKSYYPALEAKLEELRESEARLQTIFDSVNDAIFVHDPETDKILQANQRASELYGYTIEEFAEITVGDLSYGDPEEARKQAHELILRTAEGVAQVAEWRAKTKSGQDFWVELNLRKATIKNEDRILVVARDITERVTAEEALKRSEQRYRNLVENIPAGVVVHKDFRIVYVNEACVKAARVKSSDEMIGREIWDLITPECRPFYYDRYMRLLSHEHQISQEECTLLDIEGNRIDITGAALLIDFDGNEAILSMFIDISERKRAELALKESEEQYRVLFEMANDAILLMEDHKFTTCNHRSLKLFGVDSHDKIIGHSPADFSPSKQPDGSDSAEKSLEKINAALSGERQSYEWQHKSLDGRLIDAEVSLQALELHGKKLVQCIVHDVTDRKRAEEEKKAFYRQTILASTDGILNICDLLDVRPYTQQYSSRMKVGEPRQVREARRMAAAAGKNSGLDEDQLSSFMIGVGEAITNAVKHAPHGEVFIGRSNDEFWVAVSDDGPGMESLVLPYAILRRGFSTKPSLGLGYSIMLDIADRILLKTDEQGTVVVLFKKLHRVAAISLENIPDTWAGISGSK